MRGIQRRIALAALAAAGALLGVTSACSSAHTEDPAPSGELPCDVERVLTTVCQQCHSDPPRNQAPFPLVTWADTQETINGKPLYTYMETALASGRMPLAPVKLEPGDRATLLGWLQARAPAAPLGRVCHPKEIPVGPDADDDAHDWECVMDDASADAPPDTYDVAVESAVDASDASDAATATDAAEDGSDAGSTD